MSPTEFFKEIEQKQPVNIFKVTLTDETTGKIVHQQEFRNTVSPVWTNNGTCLSRYWPSGGSSNYTASTPGDTDTTLALLADTYGLSGDLALCNVYKYNPAVVGGELPQTVYSNSNPRVTGFCYRNAVSNNGDHGGVYVPSLSGFQRHRGRKWTYEWGTTQGNGTIKALGFFSADYQSPYPGYSRAALVPELAGNSGRWIYAGYRTAGLNRELYFFNDALATNNIVVLSGTDFSYIESKTITNPSPYWSGDQHSCAFVNGKAYMVETYSNTNLTIKTIAESSSMTFPASFTVPFTKPVGWTSITFYNWTFDEQYLYGLCYNQSNTRAGILKYNTLTDTVDSITEFPLAMAGVGGVGDSALFNICPFTGKLLTRRDGDKIIEAPSISQIDEFITVCRYSTNMLFTENVTYYGFPSLAFYQPTGKLIIHQAGNPTYGYTNDNFWELFRGNYYTYAEFPTAIVKTNTQSLRVEYIMTW